MVNAIRQSAWLSVKSRHISDDCTKATPSVSAPRGLCKCMCLKHLSKCDLCSLQNAVKDEILSNLRNITAFP